MVAEQQKQDRSSWTQEDWDRELKAFEEEQRAWDRKQYLEEEDPF